MGPLHTRGIYRIVQGNSVELHLGFPAFQSALAGRVSGGLDVANIMALGTFESSTQAFQAGVITVLLR